MAGVSLLALLDDIASILDDVSVMTKTAVKKTAGVLGDDLALNAQQVSGVASERELPVVWAVAKGSLVNKAILIPAALLISAFLPWLITPLLMLGGAYLCFEGAEKIWAHFNKKKAAPSGEAEKNAKAPAVDKKAKIRGAVRTDFILSAEIIVIALGAISPEASFLLRASSLILIGVLMTVGVYGLVAAIIKLDDAGLHLLRKFPQPGFWRSAGAALVGASPHLMRLLSILGTVAMFLVGGGILAHGLPWLHPITERLAALPFAAALNTGLNLAAGLLAGFAVFALIHFFAAMRKNGGKNTKQPN